VGRLPAPFATAPLPGAVVVAGTLRNAAVTGGHRRLPRPARVDPVLAAANLELTEDHLATIEGKD
jgi:hypothetical protein